MLEQFLFAIKAIFICDMVIELAFFACDQFLELGFNGIDFLQFLLKNMLTDFALNGI
jgi:hypothetical protein